MKAMIIALLLFGVSFSQYATNTRSGRFRDSLKVDSLRNASVVAADANGKFFRNNAALDAKMDRASLDDSLALVINGTPEYLPRYSGLHTLQNSNQYESGEPNARDTTVNIAKLFRLPNAVLQVKNRILGFFGSGDPTQWTAGCLINTGIDTVTNYQTQTLLVSVSANSYSSAKPVAFSVQTTLNSGAFTNSSGSGVGDEDTAYVMKYAGRVVVWFRPKSYLQNISAEISSDLWPGRRTIPAVTAAAKPAGTREVAIRLARFAGFDSLKNTNDTVAALKTSVGQKLAKDDFDDSLNAHFPGYIAFSCTLSGVSSPVYGTGYYCKNGGTVTLKFPQLHGTSNSTALYIKGIPVAVRPSTVDTYAACPGGYNFINAGGGVTSGVYAQISGAGDGYIYFVRESEEVWTPSGEKGLNRSYLTLTYGL